MKKKHIDKIRIKQFFKKLPGKLVRSVWFWLCMLLPLGLLLRTIAKNASGAADLYVKTLYRMSSLIWNNITGILPFSIGELLLLALPLLILSYFIWLIVRTAKGKGKRIRTILKGFLRIIALSCMILYMYITNCGMNYFASDFTSQSGLDVHPTSSDELYEVCIYLADKASDCRSHVNEDENGVFVVDKEKVRKKASDAVNRLHQDYDFIPDGYSLPKPVMLSRGMSYLNITGVYSPFTFEANVNVDVPSLLVPFTMCHELSHVRGFMHEEDANFIAYLACISSGDKELEYSGYINAVMYASSSLYSADKKKYSVFLSHLSDAVFRDFADYSDYWHQFETPVAETASAVNDHYLKSNSQQSGVKSYGKMTDLVIAHYYQKIKQTSV